MVLLLPSHSIEVVPPPTPSPIKAAGRKKHVVANTPPPTPSPIKATGGKKRAIADGESDEDDVFVPR